MKSTKKRTPSIVNLTVKRRYLTQREIERLIDCARKHGRYGHRCLPAGKNTANIGGAAYAPQQDEPYSKSDERRPNKPISEVAHAKKPRPHQKEGGEVLILSRTLNGR